MSASFLAHTDAMQHFSQYLRGRWVECRCQSCGDHFYKKSSKGGERCGTFECEEGYRFLGSKPPRRRYLPPLQISDAFLSFFTQRGYVHTPAVPLTGHGANHIFTGTAGQVFDRVIFDGHPYNATPYCVVQPVVRMQASNHDGFLKTFVNIALEQLGTSASEHLSRLEDYLDFLSQLGIYIGDLRLKIYEDRPDWGIGQFRSAVIGIYHDGLEIGVLNYFTDIPQRERPRLSMSDVSFGLERLAWSISRNPRFIDTVGPPMELLRHTPHDVLDAYRTAVLMLQSGIVPNRQTQAGGKLRSIFLAAICPIAPIRYDLIEYYYDWWSNFYKPPAVYNLVVSRWLSQIALQLEEKLGTPKVRALSPDDFVARLTTQGLADSRNLRGECK